MEHTKGPWSVLASSNKYLSVHAGRTQTPVAVLYEYVSETDRDELDNAECNARLIAAAPDMLEALKALLHDDDQLVKVTEATELAEQAVAKAEGKDK